MRLRGPGVPVAAWAVWIGVLALVLWLWTGDPLPPTLFTAASGAALAAAALYAARPTAPAERAVPETSVGTVLTAAGVAALAAGAVFGLWLLLIGAEVIALGLVGVLSERRAERRRR